MCYFCDKAIEIIHVCCFIDQIMPVHVRTPISEENTLEDEECEDDVITVTPFVIESDNEVIK